MREGGSGRVVEWLSGCPKDCRNCNFEMSPHRIFAQMSAKHHKEISLPTPRFCFFPCLSQDFSLLSAASTSMRGHFVPT